MAKKILIVVTSHSEMKDGKTTGVWLSEFAESHKGFLKQGYEITVASPRGGKAPVDPSSIGTDASEELTNAQRYLENTASLKDIASDDFDAIFLPGGHGAMYDLPNNEQLQTLLREFHEGNKLVAAVCHGPAGLVGATLTNGLPLVAGKRVNAFTDREEAETSLSPVLPFLLESRLRELGAIFVAAPNWSSHYEADGNLITGQNPQSTLAVTQAVIEKLG